MNIPLVDLKWQHQQIKEEVNEGFEEVMSTGAFIMGPPVHQFENDFAEFCGVKHCVGLGNGTDALEIAMRALGIGQDDEVILPANTFVASALAVMRCGAKPVLVDCDDNHLIDVEHCEKKIGQNTKAIMAVDLFGQMPQMGKLEKIASSAGIVLVEDAAQAQGASHRGRPAGSYGSIAGTSFYPGKNLGAYGDAGAITTDDGQLANRARRLRNYGSEVKYHHPEVGFNSRLDTLQAVVLGAKLKHLTMWNKMRQEAADHYFDLLGEAQGIELPESSSENEHVWHIYAVRVQHREAVLTALHKVGVGAGIHYPIPIHLLGAFEFLGHKKGDFPKAESAASEMISLPMFPGISEAQQVAVARALVAAVKDSQDS